VHVSTGQPAEQTVQFASRELSVGWRILCAPHNSPVEQPRPLSDAMPARVMHLQKSPSLLVCKQLLVKHSVKTQLEATTAGCTTRKHPRISSGYLFWPTRPHAVAGMVPADGFFC
jgi:hypothetical protein